MSTTRPQPEPVAEDHAPDVRLTAYLFDLLEIGAKVAQSVGREADLQAQPTPEGKPPHPIVDVAEQFERVSRAMRHTVLLVRHLAQPGTAHNPAHTPTKARIRITREVGGATKREAREPGEAEPLDAESRDRLDASDPHETIANRPVQDIVMGIRRDLGLEHLRGTSPSQRRSRRDIKARRRTTAPRPRDPDIQAPHGPDPGAPQSRRPPRDPDRECQRMAQRAGMWFESPPA